MKTEMRLKFDKVHNEAMAHIDHVYDSLEIVDDEYYGKSTFKVIAKFFLTADYNPYSEVANWGGFNSSAIAMSSFLHNLHHACVDDGDLSMVYSKTHGTLLVFGHPSDYQNDAEFITMNCGKHYLPEDCTVFPMYNTEHAQKWLKLRATHEVKRKVTIERIAVLKKRIEGKLK